MDLKDFLKPTKKTIVVFIALAVLSFFIITFTRAEIFPCQKAPAIPGSVYQDGICVISSSLGQSVIFKPLGYAVLFLVLFALPYLLACAANHLLKKK